MTLYKVEARASGDRVDYYCSEKCVDGARDAVPVLPSEILPPDSYCMGNNCDGYDGPIIGYGEYYAWLKGKSGRKLS